LTFMALTPILLKRPEQAGCLFKQYQSIAENNYERQIRYNSRSQTH